MFSRTPILVILMLVASGSGCANVMYEQRYRSVELVVHLPAEEAGIASQPLGIWLPSPEEAVQVSQSLDLGEFSLPIPTVPQTLPTDSAGRVRLVSEEFGRRVCRRQLLRLGSRGVESRPVFLAVIQQREEGKLTVIEVNEGKYDHFYEVTPCPGGPEVVEVIVGGPSIEITRSRHGDLVEVYLRRNVDTTPNCSLKPRACGTLTHGKGRRRSHAAA